MTIKQNRYVDIASAVIGATAVPMRKLTGRIFSTNPKIPIGSVLAFSSGQVDDFLGADSPEAKFARQYFSYVSPAPVNKPRELQIAAYEPVGRNPTVFGGDVGSLSDLQAITAGTIEIIIGSSDVTLTGINLSTATAFADVASAVQAKMNAESDPQFATGTVTFDALNSEFILTGGVAVNAAISVVVSDLADLMGLSSGINSAGVTPQSPLEAFIASEKISDSFGSAAFLTELAINQAVELAQYVSGENVKYQLHLLVKPESTEDFSAALIGTASTGLNLFTDEDFFVNALPMAVMAATDYDRTNATTNYMYRQFGVTFPSQISTDLDADEMDKLRVNYYGETAVAGSSILFYQRAFLCGGSSNPLDMSVHANEQWLKAYISQQWFTLQLSTRGIPANQDGEARARLVIADTVSNALNNGTILPGKDLTVNQQIAITDASGDDLAWHDVQDKGYWYDVDIVEQTGPSMLPEYVMKYVLIYSKGDWVRKVEGSHNLV
ncbi:MAG: DUF3383 domain-containing protein [Enterobacteriaceae bacterium]|jgi:hypothetical protein|nr:DUF3383 domain-containing protein [Enterobacteriaceae bacterium]